MSHKKDSPNYGSLVNPLLGAKVLPVETDLALPARCRLFFPRLQQLPDQDARASGACLVPGWKAPFDIRLQIRDEGLILNDSGGRSIHFEPLFRRDKLQPQRVVLAGKGRSAETTQRPSACAALAGVAGSGPSESTHLYDGCQHNRAVADTRLAGACAGGGRGAAAGAARIPVLTGVVDGFGRSLIFHREAAGELAGEITRVTDGAGRRFPGTEHTGAAGGRPSVNSASRLYPPLPVPVLFPLLRFSPTRCPPVQSTVPITVSGWRRCG